MQRGRITGLLGPDGAGKTTLMRLAAALLHPDAGQVQVLGLDTRTQAAQIQQQIGYMPQRFGLYEELSLRENLNLYADLQGLPDAERSARCAELLRLTALSPFATRRAGDLSGGMKQKLGLACTLLRAPALLLLDEPTVGVDPISRRELWSIIQTLHGQGATVLVSTAYLDEAERCDEIILLDQGHCVAQQPPAAFAAPLVGQCWRVRQAGMRRRALQESLQTRPGVRDATLEAEGVRVLLAGHQPPRAPDEDWQPRPPRFEDAFVSLLAQSQAPAAGQPVAMSAPSREQGASVRSPRSSNATIEEGIPPTPSAGLESGSAVGAETLRAPASVPAAKAETLASKPVIEVQNLRRVFGHFEAVKRISFSVTRGEVFGLLGANGAGKTTTFRMLCGLLPASSGVLRVAGVDVRKAIAAARARIGYVAQKFALYGTLSTQQNLYFFASAYGLRGARRQARLAWAVQEFALTDYLGTNAGALPLGFKQRLALACALMHEPQILFLDEPTSGVDPLARRAFWRRINHLAESGVTVMITTHFMDEAEYCDHLVLMSRGEVLALGSPQAIRAQVTTPDNPEPSMEDAFVQLIQARESGAQQAA